MCMRHISQYIYPLTISFLCICIMLMPTHYRESLYLNLELAKQGEYWRFITGHFTHYNWLHCISNILGLSLLLVLFRPNIKNDQWVIVTAVILIIVSLGLTLTSESLKWYIGFSGILTGLFAYVCIKAFPENTILSVSFLLIVITYVTNQVVFKGELIRSSIFQEISTSSYAHFFGLLGGIMYGIYSTVRYHMKFLKSKY